MELSVYGGCMLMWSPTTHEDCTVAETDDRT